MLLHAVREQAARKTVGHHRSALAAVIYKCLG
jgi:hypothetical protein